MLKKTEIELQAEIERLRKLVQKKDAILQTMANDIRQKNREIEILRDRLNRQERSRKPRRLVQEELFPEEGKDAYRTPIPS